MRRPVIVVQGLFLLVVGASAQALPDVSQIWLFPLPGETTVGVVHIADEKVNNLPTGELRHQFDLLTARRSLSVTQRGDLARITYVLFNRNSLTIPDRCSAANQLLSTRSEIMSARLLCGGSAAEVNDGFLKQLPRLIRQTTEHITFTPVLDFDRGLALGFFEAGQDSSQVSIRPGANSSIVRKFRRAVDNVQPDPNLPIYAIAISAMTDNSRGIVLPHRSAPQPITANGQLINRDLTWDIQTTNHFDGATVTLTAELLKFSTEADLQRDQPSHKEVVDVPMSRLQFVKTPWPFIQYLRSTLEVGQKLFGFIGSIPTVVAVILGLKLRKHKKKPDGIKR